MQRLPASVIRPKSARVAKVTNVPALSETTTLSSIRKRRRTTVSDDFRGLFDVKATDDKPHDASEIDDSGESTVSTRVMENDLDESVHERRSPTPLLNDDLAKLASKLSAANRARLLKLLQDEGDVVHLDDDCVPLVPQVPKDAKPFHDFVEFVMPSDNYLCGVHALRAVLSVISGNTHVALASKMRDTLFELLPCYFDVAVVGEMTYTQWARVHGMSAEAMMHAELTAVGLSNFLLAMIAYMHRVDCDIYNLCVGNPNYLILVQRSRTVTQSIGLMSVLWRGKNVSNYLGHYNVVVPADSDDVSRFRTLMSSFERIVTPSTPVRIATCTPTTSTRHHDLSSSLSPLVTPLRHADLHDGEQLTSSFMGCTMSTRACDFVREHCEKVDFNIRVRPSDRPTTKHKVCFEMLRETFDGKLKKAFPLVGHYVRENGYRVSSQVPLRELTKQTYYKYGKSYMNLKVPTELYPLFDNIDNAAAAFLFDTRFDATHPKIADTITKLKQRCKTLEEFKDTLYDLDGAYECLDNGAILPTQFQLIGKSIPAGVRFPAAFTSVNPAMAYAQQHNMEYIASKGQSLQSNGTMTPITAENSVAYSNIDALVENRAIFAIVAFEGVFGFNFKGDLYFRVVPHLLRYTILDVDVPLPTSDFTPSKNYNGHPVDDYDD